LFLVAAVVQIVIVLGFVGARESLLRRGEEIVLATVPVDPRDLFRGDYVVLRYEVSSVDLCFGSVGSRIYVPLVRAEDVYVQANAERVPPSEDLTALRSRHAGPVLKGQIETQVPALADEPMTPPPENEPGLAVPDDGRSCVVSYGIESYFVPEGTGREIEQQLGDIKVRVTVDGEGRAAIVGLVPEDDPPR
jgi:uncharacterized membrane-anchored protein